MSGNGNDKWQNGNNDEYLDVIPRFGNRKFT